MHYKMINLIKIDKFLVHTERQTSKLNQLHNNTQENIISLKSKYNFILVNHCNNQQVQMYMLHLSFMQQLRFNMYRLGMVLAKIRLDHNNNQMGN